MASMRAAATLGPSGVSRHDPVGVSPGYAVIAGIAAATRVP
jgi:hypothetical protein